ncbi:hypothetical protein [Streptomyces sp. NPDC006012]|uniref:hypothetical protein n=1 Tax=Streptomyces sp. NPDC006012 TaxID=3364739 RepID=UPI0036BD9757
MASTMHTAAQGITAKHPVAKHITAKPATTPAARLASFVSRRGDARSGPVPPRSVGTADADGWPDATQVWAWTAEVAMSGYGPGSTYFC